MAGSCRLPLHTLSSSSARFCVVSSRYGGLQHTQAEGLSRLPSPAQWNGGFPPAKTQGRANLKVVAVDENHLEAKVNNLIFDMAQTMADVAAVNADVESLQKEVVLLNTELTKLKGSVHMLRASGGRLDDHLSRYLEVFEKYAKPFSFILLFVIAFDVFIKSWSLINLLKD